MSKNNASDVSSTLCDCFALSLYGVIRLYSVSNPLLTIDIMDTMSAKKEYWDLIDSLKAKVALPFIKSDTVAKDMELVRKQSQERLDHAVSLVRSSGFSREKAAKIARVSKDRLRRALNADNS